MHITPTPHLHRPDAAPGDESSFRFTVPHSKPVSTAPATTPEAASGWQGITAGWLAAADSAA